MDQIKVSTKKPSLIIKTWERCKSIGGGGTRPPRILRSLGPKSMSWHAGVRHVAPQGYFSVYVGTEKQKFMVKAEQANHPLFRALLEEAEAEFGYSSGGPIELPCTVDLFLRVVAEMDADEDGGGDGVVGGKKHGCGLVKGYGGAYGRLLSPSH